MGESPQLRYFIRHFCSCWTVSVLSVKRTNVRHELTPVAGKVFPSQAVLQEVSLGYQDIFHDVPWNVSVLLFAKLFDNLLTTKRITVMNLDSL